MMRSRFWYIQVYLLGSVSSMMKSGHSAMASLRRTPTLMPSALAS